MIVRSRNAHGLIKSIDIEAAQGRCRACSRSTPAPTCKQYGTAQIRAAVQEPRRLRHEEAAAAALASDKVRYVGDPIACVVAETIAQAKDAAEAVEVDIEPLPVVDHAGSGGRAPARRRSSTTCRATSRSITTTATPRRSSAAFAGAAHKVKLKLINTRLVVNAMEPRAAIGSYDKAKERFTLHSVSQGVIGMKAGIVGAMKTTPDKVHVITGNVGGSFGMKAAVYPEYVCILHAARDARPAGEVDRRALVELRVRQPRPRPRADRRARARRRRPFPGACA